MASTCINDTRVRPTYVSLHKWPESEAEFVRSVSKGRRGEHAAHPKVVDSISCRQIYLRSYTFSRKESVPEKTKKCFGKVKERVKSSSRALTKRNIKANYNKTVVKRKCLVLRKAKEVSCAAFLSVVRRLLSCTAKVDVADHH